MDINALEQIIIDSCDGKNNVKFCFGNQWKEDEVIAKFITNNKIDRKNIVATIRCLKENNIVVFYSSYMLFDGQSVHYKEIEFVLDNWNILDNSCLGMIIGTKSKQIKLLCSDKHGLETAISDYCQKLIENRFNNDAQRLSEYYLSVHRKHISDVLIGGAAVKKALGYSTTNDTACAIKVGYDLIAAYYLMSSHGKRSIKHKRIDASISSIKMPASGKKTDWEKHIRKFDPYWRKAESFNYESAYWLHMQALMNHIKYCKSKHEKASSIEQLKNLLCELLQKIHENVEMAEVNDALLDQIFVVSEDERMQNFIKLGVFLFDDKVAKDYELSCKCIKEAMHHSNARNSCHYGKMAYIMSLFYRDGLGGVNQSDEERLSYLKSSANREYGLAEYELFKYFYEKAMDDGDNANERKAEKWRAKAKSHGIKDEVMYQKSLSEMFDEKIGLDGFERISESIGNIFTSITGAVNASADMFSNLFKIRFEVGSMKDQAATEKEQNETERTRQKTERKRYEREDEKADLKHKQDVAGQKATNERARKNKYKKKS